MAWLFSKKMMEDYASLPYSREQEAASLEENSLDGAQCALWNGTHTQQASWLPAKTTGACRLSRSGMTFKPLTDDHGKAVLTLFLEGFRARTFHAQGKEQELKESEAVCGNTWRELLVKFDLNTSSWKTHRCLWDEDLPLSSLTLPRWGMMQDGELWERTPPALPTNENESGLWPTPQRVDYKGTTSNSKFEQRQAQFKFWTDGENLNGMIYPNPDTYDVLMGWPKGWSASSEPATDRFLQWCQSYGISCSNDKD